MMDFRQDTPNLRGPESPDGDSCRGLLLWAGNKLKILGPHESQMEAEWLLAEVLGVVRSELYLEGRSIPIEKREQFRSYVTQREKRIPLPYIAGKAYFWEEILEIGPACLIPRPETELLVARFIENSGFKKNDYFRFLDLATGSGAIGIALMRHFPNAHATLADISQEALSVARRNVGHYQLAERTEIVQSDCFENLTKQRWDAIVCNPPYLAEADWQYLEPEIFYEPRQALDGGSDGLDFYRRLLLEVRGHLHVCGWLGLEMGIHQAQTVMAWLEEKRFEVIQCYPDYAGIDRVILAQMKLR